MGTTIYTQVDLFNIVRSLILTNLVDSGLVFQLGLTGSDLDTDSNPAGSSASASHVSVNPFGTGTVAAEVAHNTPAIPVPSNAGITKVTLQLNANLDIQPSASANSTSASSCNTEAVYDILMQLRSNANALWITTNGDLSESDDQVDNGVSPRSISLALVSTPVVSIVYDFTTNPNGDFPNLYMSYDDFITYFSNVVINISSNNEGLATAPGGGGDVTSTTTDAPTTIETNTWTMTVEWIEIATFTTEDATPSPIEVGSEIVVTPSGATPLDPDQVTEVVIDYIDSNGDPQTVTEDFTVDPEDGTLIITIILLPLDAEVVEVGVISTQFSGTVTVYKGATIYFLGASGIYRLVSGQAHDTLYDPLNPGSTVDVNIPDPFGKTGFIGG